MLRELTDDNFKQEVIEDSGIVLVDFYAQWCGPCKVLAKTMEELNDECSDKVKICKADIEENTSAVKDLNINGVPFVVLFKGGKIVNKHVGLRSKIDLQKDIDKVCDEG
jgi:thioredoxin 1